MEALINQSKTMVAITARQTAYDATAQAVLPVMRVALC